MYPRYSFRVTISNLSKLLKKQWGKIVEPLIFEKPRRKSSNAKSEKSSNSDGKHQSSNNFRARLNSMDDIIGTPVVQHVNESAEGQPSSGNSNVDEHALDLDGGRAHFHGSAEPLQVQSRKLSSIIQVDDPIDEKDEIDRDERKKKMSKSFSEHARVKR